MSGISLTEIQDFLAHIKNPLRYVTTPLLDDLLKPTDLPEDLPFVSDNSERYVTSGISINLSEIMTVYDIFLVTGKWYNPCTVYDVDYNEVIIKNTERDSLDAKKFDRIKEWETKGLYDNFTSLKPKPGNQELENIYSLSLLVKN